MHQIQVGGNDLRLFWRINAFLRMIASFFADFGLVTTQYPAPGAPYQESSYIATTASMGWICGNSFNTKLPHFNTAVYCFIARFTWYQLPVDFGNEPCIRAQFRKVNSQ